MIRDAGRNPKAFGIEGRMTLSQIPPADWGKEMEAWRAMRCISHLCVHPTNLGLAKAADHVETLRRFREGRGSRSMLPSPNPSQAEKMRSLTIHFLL